MKEFLLKCLALPLAAALALPINAQAQPLDSIVALVDDDIILRSELDLAIAGIVENIRASGQAMPPMNLIESQVLERLIIRELQVQRALQTGIRVSDADVDQTLVMMAQENGITLQQMRQLIEGDGEDFGEFRSNIAEELMTQRLQQRIANSMDPITDTEVDILLTTEELGGGEYNISNILIALQDGSTPQQIQAAQAEVDDIYRRLTEGLDFASAAISYSDSPDALEGGVIGWRELSGVPAFFADAIKELQPGEVTEPIRSPVGFHILKLNDFREQGQVMVKEFNARHIMIEVNELVSPRLAMEQIADIKGKLDNGEDFTELAKEYSDDINTANLGGDMGWFPPEAFGERVAQTLSAMDAGEISEPFQSASGWHILELLGTRETDKTEEAIRANAREKIWMQKREAEINKVLRQFRDEAFVEIRLEGHEGG